LVSRFKRQREHEQSSSVGEQSFYQYQTGGEKDMKKIRDDIRKSAEMDTNNILSELEQDNGFRKSPMMKKST
jgi:hypothetical protein